MAHLYINSKGQPWRKHSYSAGNDFDQSPYKYYLRRVLGWREHDNKARFLFGKALEESIQFHHDHNGEGAHQDFQRRWAIHKETPGIGYTHVEKDWETCARMGSDMIRLYVALQPTLPIPLGSQTVFQREYAKEVFPGDENYGGIEDAGKLDIVSYVDPTHPMLPKVDWLAEYGAFRPLIVDIKTSAQDFPEQPGMAGFDAQLRRYSWLSEDTAGRRIEDVAFLWFKKCGLGYKRGYSVTFIKKSGVFVPGEEAVIARVDPDGWAWVVKSDFMLDEIDRAQGTKNGKTEQTTEAKLRGTEFLHNHGTHVPLFSLTRQRLQFNAGRVSQASADDAGKIAARQIVQIVNAWQQKQWPNTFGIRYPKDDRNDAYFQAFVLKDEAFKNKNFTKSDEAEFDHFFDQDDPN